MIRVAIVEDNLDLLDDLQFNLRQLGLAAVGFPDGTTLGAVLAAGMLWDVLVLDLGLPGESGLSIARRLRTTCPAMGIVMLTARSGIADRIEGLEQGADIYLTKPVDMRELAAAITAVARRVGQIPREMQHWRLDQLCRQLRRPDGRLFDLTNAELCILLALVEASPAAVPRDRLISALGKNPVTYDPRALEVTISRLRQKLGDESPLKAARGLGYVFAAAVERDA